MFRVGIECLGAVVSQFGYKSSPHLYYLLWGSSRKESNALHTSDYYFYLQNEYGFSFHVFALMCILRINRLYTHHLHARCATLFVKPKIRQQRSGALVYYV